MTQNPETGSSSPKQKVCTCTTWVNPSGCDIHGKPDVIKDVRTMIKILETNKAK